MAETEELYYPLNKGEFALANPSSILKELIDEYNEIMQSAEVDEDDIEFVVSSLIMYTRNKECPHEFAQVMIILLSALAKRNNYDVDWLDGAHIALNCENLEICREFVIDTIHKLGKADVNNSNESFILLSQEDENQNVLDILGMVMHEIDRSLSEENYHELLQDFADLLAQWRDLKVPKTYDEGCYALINGIVEACCKHKAYHTALSMLGLLYISDRTENLNYLGNTMLVMGKVVYELGYREVAKRCFILADEESKGECWCENSQYKTVIQEETKLEISQEILELQKNIDEKVKCGEIKVYTNDEIGKYDDGEIEIEFNDLETQKEEQKRLGEEAIKKYEESTNANPEERLQAIDAAFAVFTEAPEVYPEAAYLYFQKGNIYLDSDFETAYDCFKRAYNCKDGKRNGLVLLGLAIVLSQMGRMKESTAYLFRTYILCGKDFVIDKVGEEPWKMVEAYL